MHELSVCQSMLSQVERIARTRCARSVSRIVVAVGPLSGVEIPLLERAFEVARAGTLAAGAVLEAETVPVVVGCRRCGAISEVPSNNLTCRACGDWRVEVRSGEDLILQSVELSGLGAKLGAAASQSPQEPEVRH